MGLKANTSARSASNFKKVPPGLHLARCYRIVDKGTQLVTYKGQEKKQPKVMIQFEVHGEDDQGQPLTTDKGEPLSISKNLTNSMFENATMRKLVQSWIGKKMSDKEAEGFSIGEMIGEWAMLSVITSEGSDGNVYSNIDNIMPVSAVQRRHLPAPHNEAKVFDLDDPDMEMFETFSEKLKQEIMQSPEWAQSQRRGVAPKKSFVKKESSGFEGMEDDIPF